MKAAAIRGPRISKSTMSALGAAWLIVPESFEQMSETISAIEIGNWPTAKAREIDQPFAAFLADLKQRGLLDSTLVMWGGEFGRKPTKDRNGNDNPGRDHNNKAFTTVLAGGGVKGGTVYGATDEFGGAAVTDKVHVHDLHATLLALLGFDHEKLTYRYNGRDFRFTDNYGKVVKALIG